MRQSSVPQHHRLVHGEKHHYLTSSRMMRGFLLLLSHFIAAILAFYMGSSFTNQTFEKSSCDCVVDGTTTTAQKTMQDFVKKTSSTLSTTSMTMAAAHDHVFPTASMGKLVVGAVHISRRDFMNTFHLGIPLQDDNDNENDHTASIMQNILLLYPSVNSLADESSAYSNNQGDDDSTLQLMSYPRQLTAQAATANCRVMKIILTQPSPPSIESSSTCLAIMGQSDSYHIQKYARQQPIQKHVPGRRQQQQQSQTQPEKKKKKNQWQLVPWQYQSSNDETITQKTPLLRLQTPPKPVAVRQAWQTLQSYLSVYQDAVQQLRPMVEHIIGVNTASLTDQSRRQQQGQRRGLIIMVCNYGHVELLVNFYCAARAIGMDLSRVLLFATDIETLQVAQQQLMEIGGDDDNNGLYKNNIFYHEGLFTYIPTDAATTYGSLDYAAIMMSKVYVSHLLTLVGEYDFLFHDVDIVPYRPDYLDHLLDMATTTTDSAGNSGNDNDDNDVFDMYFQYDHLGGPAEYQPWYANSGFYLVRHNARTRHFFSVLVRQGDLILRSKSHQTVMTALLNEHINLYGLRVKVLQEEADLFPGGYHYHKKWDYMKAMMQGKVTPYIMHMNYNDNKETKRKFNEQIGNWFVQDSCIHEGGRFIIRANTTTTSNNKAPNDNRHHSCCIAHPKPKCYYRDKPSKIPCRDFPQVEGGQSFW